MEKLEVSYKDMSRDELISIIGTQRNELIKQDGIIKEYKKHLEQVIEFNSVEKYRETVKRNREVANTTPQCV
jgi:hypothetical protein